MNDKFKPMLADEANLDTLRFPIVASPKLDGVRATFLNGVLHSRSLKQFPNPKINATFKFNQPLDGELIMGEAHHPEVFRNTMKVVSSHTADIEGLTFRVFDYVEGGGFHERFRKACSVCDYQLLTPVPHTMLSNLDSLLRFEEDMLNIGFEGIMLRDPNGQYKFGRSTVREGGLLKLKRKQTAEARVVGFEEQMHNANELKTDALGYAERSSHQANLVPMGTLGALVCEDLVSRVQFNVGTGFSAADRAEIWKHRETYLSKVLTYEYLPIGVKDKPRHPTFKGWRIAEDIS